MDSQAAAETTMQAQLPSMPNLSTMRFKMARASLLAKRFQLFPDKPEQLQDAIATYEFVSNEDTPVEPSLHLDALINLSLCYTLRYRFVTDDMGDLDKGIQINRRVLAKQALTDAKRAQVLNNLAEQLRNKFTKFNKIETLDESIDMCQEAISLPRVSPRDQTIYRQNLGQRLHDRYDYTWNLSDINESISLAEANLAQVPSGAFRVEVLNALGTRLSVRSDRPGGRDDLKRAAKYLAEALNLIADGSTIEPILLYNLTAVHYRLYTQSEDLHYLEAAIDYSRKGLSKSSVQRHDRPRWMVNTASMLEDLYTASTRKQGQSLGDLTSVLHEAIELSKRAVVTSGADYPYQARFNLTLGRLLQLLHQKTKDPEDHATATRHFMSSANHAPSPILDRLHGARRAMTSLAFSRQPKWAEAAKMADLALQLIPRVILRGSQAEDHIYILQLVRNLSPTIVSVLIKAARPGVDVLNALESSRGIISGLAISTKSMLSDLAKRNPQLEQQYGQLLESLRSSPFDDGNSLLREPYTLEFRRRQQQISKIESMEREAHQLHGLPAFNNSAYTEEEYLRLAGNDNLVCFNTSQVASHAILVSRTIRILELPKLQPKKLREIFKLLPVTSVDHRDGEVSDDEEEENHPNPNEQLNRAMGMLWDVAVKPVLTGLQIDSSPSELPCVYWVGGGLLSLLPLHAAGDTTAGSTDNTFSRVVSSYATTFRALAYSRRPHQDGSKGSFPKLLAVGMPSTPGMNDISAKAEILAIKKHFDHTKVVALLNPLKSDVLNELRDCSLLHLACHGRANIEFPRKSCVILGKDTKEEMTVEDVDSVSGDTAHIAYLSACSSAEVGEAGLLDETIHLASAFQVAGYRHVIGTMMKVRDGAAVRIADNFYRLLRDEKKDFADCSISRVLHRAIKLYRDQDPSCGVLDWAPFLHMGG